MNIKDKNDFWRRHFEAWKRSGLQVVEYAREHKLNADQFYYYRRRLIEIDAKVSVPGKFMSVTVDQSPSAKAVGAVSSGLRIVLPDGTAVEWIGQADSAAVGTLLSLIRGRSL